MSVDVQTMEHERLLQEILAVLGRWPDLDRTVFSQAHYNGESPESVSRSLHLDVEEVSAILKQCEYKLHASLRDFRTNVHLNVNESA
jgi:DNA-directed RNA polymerase specialized sigma24 family protein